MVLHIFIAQVPLTPAAGRSNTPNFPDNSTEGDNIEAHATCKTKPPVPVPDLLGELTGYDIAVASPIPLGIL